LAAPGCSAARGHGGAARESAEPARADAARPTLRWEIGALPTASGDPELLQLVWIKLLANALKNTRTASEPASGRAQTADDGKAVVLRCAITEWDSDMALWGKLFNVFQRLHRQRIRGIGIGLAWCGA